MRNRIEKIFFLKNKNILFLESPHSLFYKELFNRTRNTETDNEIKINNFFKINFNKSDKKISKFFDIQYDYLDTFDNFEKFLVNYIITNNITNIIMYDKDNKYNILAMEISHKLKIEFYLFDKGYLGEDFITSI